MISCEKIKELLMTSYIDNELDETTRNQVEEHLAGCSACRELKELLINDIITPMEGTVLEEPSPAVWAAIEEEIAEPEYAEEAEPVWERIRRAVLRPVPVAAVSFAIIGMLIVSIYYTTVPSLPKNADIKVEDYFSRHLRFFDYLESNGGDYYTRRDHLGLISPIEKYLY